MRNRSDSIGYRIVVDKFLVRIQIKFRCDAAKWSGDMDDMVVFISGGGSGIGEAAAKLLARRGAKVALAGRTPDELAEVAEAIGGAGGTAITVTCDVSDEDSVRSAIATTVETWGRLDVVVANAGVNGTWAGIEELAVEEFRSTLDINLVGTFTTIKYSVPHLRRRGGSVIVTSSVNGTRIFSNSGASAYSSSKAGQVALAKMLAVELGPDKIRVNVICPGAINTEIGDNTAAENDDVKIPVEYPEGNIPLTGGKSGSAEQVGELIAFLASDESSHISGTEIWIDGAQSLLQG
jgi:NAD(P)-dependent dehydrogenase (short-subunit alcohol dehydrogenase family)